MTTAKRLTSKSGVTIPKQIRAETGFVPGMAVDIETTPDGILIRKRTPICRFCGNVEGIVHVVGMEMCRVCAANLKQEVERYGI